jgi:hypothetical protein
MSLRPGPNSFFAAGVDPRPRLLGRLVRSSGERQQMLQLSLDADRLGDHMIDQGVELPWRRTKLAAGEVARDVLARRGQFQRSHLRRRRAQLVGFELDADGRASRAMLVEQGEERIQRFREQAKDLKEHAISAAGVKLADDRQRADF